MFSKLFAAAALAVVSAADVPVFSSNDDYDEINLNIRMLSGNTTTEVTSGTVVVAHQVKLTMTFPDGTTIVTLGSSATFKAGFCAATIASMVAAGATAPSSCEVTAVTDGSRRARALQTSLTVAVDYGLTMPASAAAAATTLLTTAGGSFSTALSSSLVTALVTSGFVSSASEISAPTVVVATTTTTAAAPTPAAAAAAPSPSPSSNAAKVAVSTVAAFAAFMASMM